jgi:hypothetical protein
MADLEPTVIPESASPDWRRGLLARVSVLGAVGLIVASGVVAIALATRGGDTDDGSTDDSSEVVFVELEPAGPYDGLESVGLPVIASPDVGLVDGQLVEATGSGFEPGTQVGMVQCWLSEKGGSQEDCDLGTLVWGNADDQGVATLAMNVNRFIGTSYGTQDCAQGGISLGCRLGMGQANDYDRSGSARIFFDPEVEGEQPPRLTVTPWNGLFDSDRLEITGEGFVPGEEVLLTQCEIGGLNGIVGCFGSNPTSTIEADQAGVFHAAIEAVRVVQAHDGPTDCFVSVYGCNVVATATRSPNPVSIYYDGSTPRPHEPEFTLSPSDGLTDGMTVAMTGRFVPSDGLLTIEQCVDQGAEGLTCIDVGSADAVDGEFATTVTVSVTMVNGEGDELDCRTPRRNCHLRPLGAVTEEVVQVPLRFAAAE